MKTLGYYNGKIDELDKITVPMLDRACYFGDGVYDVTFCRNYKIYKLHEHVERIFQSAALLKIFPEITPNELCDLLESLVKKLDSGELWVYFQFSRGTDFRNHAFPENATPNLWIMLKPAAIKDNAVFGEACLNSQLGAHGLIADGKLAVNVVGSDILRL